MIKIRTLFWPGEGMLLYLVKPSRPDIANTTWELSKINDRAAEASFHEMHSAMIYFLDTNNMGIR